MAGSTASKINAVVDSVITLVTNATTIGTLTGVYERDEHPAIPANEGRLPCAYVVPLVEGKDVIRLTMTPSNMYHTFPIHVMAYYNMPDVSTSLRTVRDYAYDMVDIFATNTSLPVGQISPDMTVESGYWTNQGGYVIHYWIVGLTIKTLF